MKRTITFSVFLLLLMTSVSSYCFCAHETVSSGVSFQSNHRCCDSNAQSHCKAHVGKTCYAEGGKEFALPSLRFQADSEANQISLPILSFSLTSQSDSHQAASLSLTAFPKIQESLFLKNEVLRI